jgi:hypothetical protein
MREHAIRLSTPPMWATHRETVAAKGDHHRLYAESGVLIELIDPRARHPQSPISLSSRRLSQPSLNEMLLRGASISAGSDLTQPV